MGTPKSTRPPAATVCATWAGQGVLLFLLLYNLTGPLVALSTRLLGPVGGMELLALTLAVNVLLKVWPALFLSRRAHRCPAPVRRAFPHLRAALLFLGAVCLVNGLVGLVQQLFGIPDGGVGPVGGAALVLTFLLSCLLPAVLEESFFRGALMRLLAGFGAAASVGASTVLFVFAHSGPWQLPAALVLGFLLGFMRQRGASLGFCIGLHLAANTLALALQVGAQRGFEVHPLLAVAIGIILAACGILAGPLPAFAPQPARAASPTRYLWDNPVFAAACLFAFVLFGANLLIV